MHALLGVKREHFTIQNSRREARKMKSKHAQGENDKKNEKHLRTKPIGHHHHCS